MAFAIFSRWLFGFAASPDTLRGVLRPASHRLFSDSRKQHRNFQYKQKLSFLGQVKSRRERARAARIQALMGSPRWWDDRPSPADDAGPAVNRGQAEALRRGRPRGLRHGVAATSSRDGRHGRCPLPMPRCAHCPSKTPATAGVAAIVLNFAPCDACLLQN